MSSIIELLNNLPSEITAIIQLFCCVISINVLVRLYGSKGVYIYVCVAIIVANIQVLKGTKFIFLAEPVAMGTIVFSSITIAIDILIEYVNREAGIRAISISFAALVLFNLMMVLTLGMRPLVTEQLIDQSCISLFENHHLLLKLFSPLPLILLASMIAYLTSQFLDVILFSQIRKITGGKWLWLRTGLASCTAAFVDNFIFSFLAWKLFSDNPISWNALIWTYVLGTYPLRVIAAIAHTPCVYWAKRWFKD